MEENRCIECGEEFNYADPDCSGTCGGLAEEDNCGVCSGGTTGISPCIAGCNFGYCLELANGQKS